MRTFILVLVVLALAGCASGPGSTPVTSTPIATTAAQEVGQDQGTAQASETGAATVHVTPVIVNAFAAKTVTVQMQEGQPTVTVEGSADSSVNVGGPTSFGNLTFGDEATIEAHTESGGGAAGGTGGTARSASGNTGERASGTVTLPPGQ